MILQSKSIGNKQYCPISAVDKEDGDGQLIEGEWRTVENSNNLLPINRVSSNMYGQNSEDMRSQLNSYFLFDGAIPFQWNK